ncbi:hypothetical protein [uncultured Anaerofustis sp.]|uniref:hypothetical protein n=1 Tax=uncultured Anaerofustis sp. TaxID=904996 RepID=UPI0025D16CB2|nr:hypothetical protein [uncultured Anaerofustis sp.]
MKRKEFIDVLDMIKDTCINNGSGCEGCPFLNSENNCIMKEKCPWNWNTDSLTNRLFPTITHDEYIILKNLKEPWKEGYITRDREGNGNKLIVFLFPPVRKNGFWYSDNMYFLLDIYLHIFKSIKWEDEEPRKIRDLIKEYEEVHGIC